MNCIDPGYSVPISINYFSRRRFKKNIKFEIAQNKSRNLRSRDILDLFLAQGNIVRDI